MFGKEDRYNTQGFSEFMEGTHAITDWKINSKAIFKELFNSMSNAWNKAMDKLKTTAENL